MQINADFKDIKKLENFLEKFNKTGVKFATRNTLNTLAFDAMREAKEVVGDSFINRNTFTVRSIQVNKAGFGNVNSMHSEIGSTQQYMEKQEEGGIVKAKQGSKNLAIATTAAANQTGNRRTRLVTRANKLRNIVLRDKNKLSFIQNKRQRAVGIIANAKKNKLKHFYLDLGNTKGIFSLKSGKLKMIYNLKYTQRKIKATHWLSNSSEKVAKNALQIYNKQLEIQIDRIIF